MRAFLGALKKCLDIKSTNKHNSGRIEYLSYALQFVEICETGWEELGEICISGERKSNIRKV